MNTRPEGHRMMTQDRQTATERWYPYHCEKRRLHLADRRWSRVSSHGHSIWLYFQLSKNEWYSLVV